MKQKSFIYILISFIAVNAIIEEIDSEGLFDYSNYEQGMTDSSIAFKTFYKNCNDKYISIKDDLIKKKEEIFKNFEKEELKEFKEFLKLDKKEDDKIKKNKIKESIKTLETIKIEMKEEKIENELSIKGNLGMIEKTVENNFELIKTKLKEDLNKKNEFFEETYKDLNKLEESIKSEIIEYENIIADLDTVEIKLKEENVSGFKFVLQKLIETKTCLKDGKNRKEALKKFKSVKTSFDKEYEKIKKQNKELGKYVNKLTSKKEILLEILKLLEKVLIENKSHKNNIKMCEKTEKEFVNEIKKLKVYFKNNEKIQNDFQYNEQTLKNKIYELKKDIEEYKNITEKLETVEKTLENVSSFEVFIQNLREMKKSLLDGESREKVLKKLENIKTSFAEGVNKNKHLLNSFLKSLTKSEEENYKKYQKKWKIPVIKDFDAKTLETANLKDFVINLKDYRL